MTLAATNLSDTDNRSTGPVFSAVLRPHRSLPPKGFGLLMAVFGGLSLGAGVFFVQLGAWPVCGFFGLDVLLLYGAFRLSYNSARICEIVELFPDLLRVRRIRPRKPVREWRFQPYWLRVEIEEHGDIVGPLRLVSHGTGLSIAGFLGGRERKRFAGALTAALARFQR